MPNKSKNQLHGKIFEDLMKASGRFMGSADIGRSSTQGFDIEVNMIKITKCQPLLRQLKAVMLG